MFRDWFRMKMCVFMVIYIFMVIYKVIPSTLQAKADIGYLYFIWEH